MKVFKLNNQLLDNSHLHILEGQRNVRIDKGVTVSIFRHARFEFEISLADELLFSGRVATRFTPNEHEELLCHKLLFVETGSS
jgi:hypothetical protein